MMNYFHFFLTILQERERELESRGEFDKLEEEREARERRKRAAEEERRQRETKLAYDDEDDDLELLASRIPDHAEQVRGRGETDNE